MADPVFRFKEDGEPENKPAAAAMRHKLHQIYGSQEKHEPNFAAEVEEIIEQDPHAKLSKHQQFVYDLAASGKPTRDINQAWHEYYRGLSDEEKHQVWREFNEAHLQASKLLRAAGQQPPARRRPAGKIETAIRRGSRKAAHQAVSRIPEKQRQPLKSLAFGLTVGFVFLLIFMFTFFNERFIAPFIQPSRSVDVGQVITAKAAVSTKPEILIPKINVEIPVVYWVTTTDEKEVQAGLDNGVVHYADTAQPGQDGNVVIVGHSASNIFNKGRYKFAFSLLHRLDTGDTFYIQKDGVRYTYQIYKMMKVKPTQVSVLAADPKLPAIATLITCDPPGTNSNRLVVVGKQVSPDPAKNRKQRTASQAAVDETAIIPGNSQSLWSRLVHWFTGSEQ